MHTEKDCAWGRPRLLFVKPQWFTFPIFVTPFLQLGIFAGSAPYVRRDFHWGTGTRRDYLANRADKKNEMPVLRVRCCILRRSVLRVRRERRSVLRVRRCSPVAVWLMVVSLIRSSWVAAKSASIYLRRRISRNSRSLLSEKSRYSRT